MVFFRRRTSYTTNTSLTTGDVWYFTGDPSMESSHPQYGAGTPLDTASADCVNVHHTIGYLVRVLRCPCISWILVDRGQFSLVHHYFTLFLTFSQSSSIRVKRQIDIKPSNHSLLIDSRLYFQLFARPNSLPSKN